MTKLSHKSERPLHYSVRLTGDLAKLRSVQDIFKSDVQVSAGEDIILKVGTGKEGEVANL